MQTSQKNHIKTTGLWMGCTLILSLLLSSPIQAVLAAPWAQAPIYTPTAQPDGKIIYIVKANDTLLSISLLTGLPVEKLRGLNNLTGDTIYEGEKLLLGLAGPAEITFTPGPSPTPTSVIPTSTPQPGSGTLCIILFEDRNGDSIRQTGEDSISNGAISVSNRSGSVSLTENTTNTADPFCFQKVPEGEYTVSIAVPSGYNPTTASSYSLILKTNDETYIDFGAQATSQTAAQEPSPRGGGKSPLLGILGGLFILAGGMLAVFATRLLKGRR
jgi:LysM repeat protein